MLAIIVTAVIFLIPAALVIALDVQQRLDFKRNEKSGENFDDFRNRYYSRY